MLARCVDGENIRLNVGGGVELCGSGGRQGNYPKPKFSPERL
jgi:hypothetical protein